MRSKAFFSRETPLDQKVGQRDVQGILADIEISTADVAAMQKRVPTEHTASALELLGSLYKNIEKATFTDKTELTQEQAVANKTSSSL
ncbi:MAG: hypothetical protein A3F18_07405 [Legionellales bacterium RIFCSPHIGHO2_12_FULL_37_14]|nr:MAG: hypothetical protein A3F18_07405 [Legionellales bacterium RIFCSPHIGHO2_12_FULL_37_14]